MKNERITLRSMSTLEIDDMKKIFGGANDKEISTGCCGCACAGPSSTADNSSANVVGFKSSPGTWKGDVMTYKGICILAEYNSKTGKYTEIDHGSKC